MSTQTIANIIGPTALPASPACKVSGSTSNTTLSVPGGGVIKLPVVIYDRTGIYNVSTGVFTIPVTGVYRVGLSLVQTTNASTNYSLNVNGTVVCNLQQKATGYGNDSSYCQTGTTDHLFTKGSAVTVVANSAISLYVADATTSQIYLTFLG